MELPAGFLEGGTQLIAEHDRHRPIAVALGMFRTRVRYAGRIRQGLGNVSLGAALNIEDIECSDCRTALVVGSKEAAKKLARAN